MILIFLELYFNVKESLLISNCSNQDVPSENLDESKETNIEAKDIQTAKMKSFLSN